MVTFSQHKKISSQEIIRLQLKYKIFDLDEGLLKKIQILSEKKKFIDLKSPLLQMKKQLQYLLDQIGQRQPDRGTNPATDERYPSKQRRYHSPAISVWFSEFPGGVHETSLPRGLSEMAIQVVYRE